MISYNEFEEEWLKDVLDGNPSSIQKGNRFTEKIIRDAWDFDNSTSEVIYCDGAGDGGIDAVIFSKADPSEGIDGDCWTIIQSKFGTSYSGSRTVLEEGMKFISTLEGKRDNLSSISNDVILRIKNFLENKGPKDRLEYVLATCRNISKEENDFLNNIKLIGREKFGNIFDIDAISIETIYNRISEDEEITGNSIFIPLETSVTSSDETLHIGSTKVRDIYKFMMLYKEKSGEIDLLYEKNVRKFLGPKKKVNKGIESTLENCPERFGLYNNGITIVAENVKSNGNGVLELGNPYIVNGCQTTKSIWSVLQRKLHSGGSTPSQTQIEWEQRLSRSVVITKIVVVGSAGEELLTATTKYTNSQNSISEKDFIALEKDFRNWAPAFNAKYNVFLEIQRGAWEARKAYQKQNPSTYPQFEESANAFELLKAYAAAFLSEPGIAYGKNPPFAPGGSIFNKIVNEDGFGIERLYSAHLLLKLASKYGFGRGTKIFSRGQTKYLFLLTTYSIIRDFMNSNGIGVESESVSRAINALASENKLVEIGDTAIQMIDDYLTQGSDDPIFEEPEFKKMMDLNMCLKSEKLGNNEDAFPNFKTQLTMTKKMFKKNADIKGLIAVIKQAGN